MNIMASAVTIIVAFVGLARWLNHFKQLISNELWENAFHWKIKEYIAPQYTIEGWNGKKGEIDRLLAKLLMKNHQARTVLVVGESGVGKSFLCVKIYHRLIFRAVTRGYHLKYVNAALLDSFNELGNDPEVRKTILFLDGLDEYPQFLRIHTPEIINELYYNLHKKLSEYGRVVICARDRYYNENKKNVDWVCYHLAGCDVRKVVKVTLTGMEDQQIRKYLKKNLKLTDDKIKRCIDLVHSSKEILSRPVFLRFLEELPTEISYSNSYKVYEEIVKKWMIWEKDKSLSSSNPIGKADLRELFDQLTERYFSNLFAGHTAVYFQPKDILSPQSGIDNPILGSRALLRYNPQYGYYCIHHSFFEFNYVRMHYKEMCRRGMKEKKFMQRNLKTFYEECHYNRTFVANFPQAEVLLLKSGKKPLSELRPEEAGRIIQLYIFRSKDLLIPEFQKFIQGLNFCSFRLGSWKVNNIQLRRVLQNKYLNLSEERLKPVQELAWFHDFPIYALNLSHTGIRTLEFLKDFPLLERFVSVGNPLDNINGIRQCTNLQYLNLSNCGLTSFVLRIQWPASLRKLIISNNEILSLDFVSRMHLEELDVSDNPLQSGAESFMGVPGKVRCVYHFGSDELKAIILKGKQKTEIQYGDLMSFLQNNRNTVRLDDKIKCVFGLENISCKCIMFPIELISSLNTLSKPLYIYRASILSGHGYKLGYMLNDFFSLLTFQSKGQMGVKHAVQLRNQCNSLIDYLADYEINDEIYSFRCNEDLKGIMEEQTFSSCLQEVFMIAGICLKCIRQYEASTQKRFPSRFIDDLVCRYIDMQCVSDNIQPENVENLSEQQKRFKEQGEEFARAISTIRFNSKGISKFIWGINRRKHHEMEANCTQWT